MEIRTAVVKVTTTGSAGSAAGTSYSESLHGFLLDITVDFHASAPGTTDTTIALAQPALGNLLTLTDTATDVTRYAIRDTARVPTAGAVTDPDGYDRIALNGRISVVLAQSDALTDAVTVTIRYLAL